jgi:hypothetical protein
MLARVRCCCNALSPLPAQGLWRFVSLMSTLRKQYGDLLNPPLTFVPPKPGAPPLNRELRWHGAGPGGVGGWIGVVACWGSSNSQLLGNMPAAEMLVLLLALLPVIGV